MRSKSLAWLIACVGALAAAFETRAQDNPAVPVEIEWSAPRECPDRDAVLRILSERLAHRQALLPLRARAQVLRSGSQYRLELELDGPSGRAHRELGNSQCGSLAEAAAVLIALALEPPAAEAIQEPSEPEPAAPDSPDKQAPDEPPKRAPRVGEGGAAAGPEQRAPSTSSAAEADASLSDTGAPEITHDLSGTGSESRLQLQLSAAARADLGTFPPRPAFGVQGQLELRIARLYIALGATYWPPREQRSLSYPNARLKGSGLFGELSVGVDVPAQAVMLTAALCLEIGRLNAEALGIAGPEHNHVLWAAVGPSLSAGINLLSKFRLGLELSGLVPAYRTHWFVRTPEGDVRAFDAAPVVVRVALRMSYALR